MKRQIFLYLFLFTLLILIFQLVNSNKVLTRLETDWRKEITLRKQMQDSLQGIQDRLDDEVYFTLQQNAGAQEYFPDHDLADLESQLMDLIYETNLPSRGKKIIPFDPIGEAGYLINKVKVLNHKWIIADFTDGTYWGELLILYRLRKDGGVDFEVRESFIYPLAK